MSEGYDMIHDDEYDDEYSSVKLENASIPPSPTTVSDTNQEIRALPSQDLLSNTLSEKLRDFIHKSDHNGYTLLHRAVKIADFELVKSLLEMGADPFLPTSREVPNGEGFPTPFDLTMNVNYPSPVRHLLWSYIKKM